MLIKESRKKKNESAKSPQSKDESCWQ